MYLFFLCVPLWVLSNAIISMYNSICKFLTVSSLALVNVRLNLVTSGTHTHTVTLTHTWHGCRVVSHAHIDPLGTSATVALMQFWACAKLNYQFALFISRTYFICAVATAVAAAAAAADSDSIALTLTLLAVLFFCPLLLLTALPLSHTLLFHLPSATA